MSFENTLGFAKNLDEQDPLKHFRQKFFIPQHNGKDKIYFDGNSIGSLDWSAVHTKTCNNCANSGAKYIHNIARTKKYTQRGFTMLINHNTLDDPNSTIEIIDGFEIIKPRLEAFHNLDFDLAVDLDLNSETVLIKEQEELKIEIINN